MRAVKIQYRLALGKWNFGNIKLRFEVFLNFFSIFIYLFWVLERIYERCLVFIKVRQITHKTVTVEIQIFVVTKL